MNRRVPVGVSLLVFSMTLIASFCNVEFSHICVCIFCEPKMSMVSDIEFRMRSRCSMPFASRAFKPERQAFFFFLLRNIKLNHDKI